MILDNMNPFEKEKLLGQKLGYAPLSSYLCAECVLNKRQEAEDSEEELDATCEYSLVVESESAIVLSVKKYEVQHRFPSDVKNLIYDKMKANLGWIRRRTGQISQQHIDIYKKD